VRLRNGVIGLVATVALVALAWQTWSAEQQTGPVSLLDLELGQGGGYRVHEDPKDLITAEVRGLSHVRQKLGVALGSLHKANKFGAPPGVQVRCCGRVRRWRAYAGALLARAFAVPPETSEGRAVRSSCRPVRSS
jgi:hypothetical protein